MHIVWWVVVGWCGVIEFGHLPMCDRRLSVLQREGARDVNIVVDRVDRRRRLARHRCTTARARSAAFLEWGRASLSKWNGGGASFPGGGAGWTNVPGGSGGDGVRHCSGGRSGVGCPLFLSLLHTAVVDHTRQSQDSATMARLVCWKWCCRRRNVEVGQLAPSLADLAEVARAAGMSTACTRLADEGSHGEQWCTK